VLQASLIAVLITAAAPGTVEATSTDSIRLNQSTSNTWKHKGFSNQEEVATEIERWTMSRPKLMLMSLLL
jgi:hypothetical protein